MLILALVNRLEMRGEMIPKGSKFRMVKLHATDDSDIHETVTVGNVFSTIYAFYLLKPHLFSKCFDHLAWGLKRELVHVSLVHLFVYFSCVNFCPFSLPLGVRYWHSLDFSLLFFVKHSVFCLSKVCSRLWRLDKSVCFVFRSNATDMFWKSFHFAKSASDV